MKGLIMRFPYVLLALTATIASAQTSILDCPSIKDTKKRLECFDKTIKVYAEQESKRLADEAQGRQDALADDAQKKQEALAKASDPNRMKPEQVALAETALKALRKIASATEVGISYRDYGARVADAAPDVDSAIRELPPSDVREALVQARSYYVKAVEYWSGMVQSPYVSVFFQVMGDKMRADGLEPNKMSPGAYDRMANFDRSQILSPLWAKAQTAIENTSVLIKAGRLNRATSP